MNNQKLVSEEINEILEKKEKFIKEHRREIIKKANLKMNDPWNDATITDVSFKNGFTVYFKKKNKTLNLKFITFDTVEKTVLSILESLSLWMCSPDCR